MQKLWKKVISLSLVLVMVLGFGMVSNAQGSADAPSKSANGVTALTDKILVYPMTGVNAEKYPYAMKHIQSADKLKEILGSKYQTGMNLEVLAFVDVEIEGSEDADEVSVDSVWTFSVDGVKKGDKMFVFHYATDEYQPEYDTNGEWTGSGIFVGDWEVLEAEATADGVVEMAAPDSCSPFAFVRANRAATGTTSTATGTASIATTTKKSPKTGEF